jgi:hypothetical protein
MKASSRVIFVISLAFLVVAAAFGYGYVVGKDRFWPYSLITQARQVVDSLWKFGEVQPEDRVVIAPPGAARKRLVIHHPDQQMKGLYVFLGYDDANKYYTAWLYDDAGKQLFAWVLDYARLDPDGPSNESDTPHAFWVLPDGSVIVGFDRGDVMARLDSCGEPLWIKQGIYHHSLTRADDGTFWTWRAEGTPYSQYQYIENFDGETGKQIRQIALIEDVIRNLGSASFIFGVRPDRDFRHLGKIRDDSHPGDIFHPNDVDVLPARIAQQFPGFEAGDLLLSFKELHLVTVMDPDTLQVKWWSHGPWLYQHDPDFTDDGKISVFSNYTKQGRSEIIRMDPETRQTSNELFGGDLRFYTNSMGVHQYLPNGNLLVVVPGEGRIVEVSARGQNVMEFNNLSRSAGYNGHVENAQWVPLDYFRYIPSCPRLNRE